MQEYSKFVIAILSFALFAIAVFLACIVYYIIQKKKIISRNKNLPANYRIDTANLTPLNIVVVGSKELRSVT